MKKLLLLIAATSIFSTTAHASVTISAKESSSGNYEQADMVSVEDLKIEGGDLFISGKNQSGANVSFVFDRQTLKDSNVDAISLMDLIHKNRNFSRMTLKLEKKSATQPLSIRLVFE